MILKWSDRHQICSFSADNSLLVQGSVTRRVGNVDHLNPTVLMTKDQVEENMLFGVLALQAKLITAQQFARACALWSDHADRPLGGLLQEQGWLTAEAKALIDRQLEQRLQR